MVRIFLRSGIGWKVGSWSSATKRDKVAAGTGQRRLILTLHHKPGIGNHLKIGTARLAFAGQVITEEDRIGKVKSERLQRAEVNLPAAGDPDFGVGEEEPEEGEDAQTPLRCELPFVSQGGSIEGDQEVDGNRVGVDPVEVNLVTNPLCWPLRARWNAPEVTGKLTELVTPAT